MPGRPTAAQVSAWAEEIETIGGWIGGRFARSEPRQRAIGYVRGLLSSTERKNGWRLAEHLGDPTPDGVQHLLARADWDADTVRDDQIGYVKEHLGHPDGVLVVDETGFLKKGAMSAGVARQYSGTAGRIENCQVGVFLGYAATKGRALLDRALYLPKEWANDKVRRKRAGVPGAVVFATKIALARRMIDRAVAAGVPATWVTADAVYGSDYHFRVAVEGHGLGYVVGVRADFAVCVGLRQVRARAVLAGVPADGWHRLSCGDGSKGPRVYDWALLRTNSPEPDECTRWLLIRRSTSDPSDVAYFACGGPPAATLSELVRVAGARWAITRFTRGMVLRLIGQLGLGCRSPHGSPVGLGPGEYRPAGLARRLGVNRDTVRRWVRVGWVHARRDADGHHVIWADAGELRRLRELSQLPRTWANKDRLAELTKLRPRPAR